MERRFRKVVGRSINGELLRLRINRAIELLTETEVELKAVAVRAGFGSQSYMNAVFQAKVGKTPGSFRRSARPKSMGAAGQNAHMNISEDLPTLSS